MEKRVVSETLVLATSMDCYKSDSGTRNVNMPYWVAGDNALVFEFIGTHTEPAQLEWKIGEGKVWVREVDAVD